MNGKKILVVDDELSMRQFLKILLKKDGYEVDTAGNGDEALKRLAADEYGVILMDYNMPEAIDGIPLLHEFRKRTPGTQVVVITAYASTEQAIKALELGAIDYVSKPFNVKEIRDIVKRAFEERGRNSKPKSTPPKQESETSIVAESPQMKRLLDLAGQVASSDSTVLITGESGTGKEVLARYIHDRSGRNSGPWYPINCGAIPENLQESQLFGHEKGAFTGAHEQKKGYFETAFGGTLFLDEIGELSENIQVKLLRVLQERTFMRVGGVETIRADVRLIAATNRDLRDEVSEGRFRSDLFFRLNVFEIEIPPLRERREDIIPLSKLFLNELGEREGRTLKLSPDTEKFFMEYDFPGNVRELHNMIERGVVLSKSGVVELEKIKSVGSRKIQQENSFDFPLKLDEVLADVERSYIRAALTKTGWNRHETAVLLGMTERSLRYRMDKLGIKE